VGGAQILTEHEAFGNAREPIGQVFVPVAEGADSQEGEEFFFAVNHFKSKGSPDDADADLPEDPVQGNARTSRLQQAEALIDWAGTSPPPARRSPCSCSTTRATPTWPRSTTPRAGPTASTG